MKMPPYTVVALVASGGLCIGSFVAGFATAPWPPAQGITSVVSSQVVARDIPTYTRQAKSVVVGTVVEIGDPYEFDLGVNCETTIRHDVTVAVERVLHGEDEGSQVTLAVEGGSIGNETVTAQDEAAFRDGERVLVFVGTNEDGDDIVFAGAYGKLTVSKDGASVFGNAGLQLPLQAVIDEIQAAVRPEGIPG